LYNTTYEWLIFGTNQFVYINISPIVNGPYVDYAHLFRSTCPFNPEIDTDADGIPDSTDPVINSNIEPTILIGNCDSQVANFEFGDGYTFADKIDELEAAEFKNHGQFVKAVSQYLNTLIDQGLISIDDKDQLMACAGSSNL